MAKQELGQQTVFIEESLYRNTVFQGFVISETLYEGKSDYQTIEIYSSPRYGRVLVLDGIVQTTENDEFIYHELITHVPLFTCQYPERVLIVGGGDGGALREALRHPQVEVDMVEIDQKVVDISIEYLPTLNEAGAIFDHKRAHLIIEDAFHFLKHTPHSYDAIIIDSTDPIGAGGAAEPLFGKSFYALCKEHLKPDGIIVAQSGVVFLQGEETLAIIRNMRAAGLQTSCFLNAVPTYFGGSMAFACAAHKASLLQPDLAQLSQRYAAFEAPLRCYNPELHAAAFALPNWVKDLLP